MDPKINLKRWKDFLSSITPKTSSTNNSTIKTESSSRCLATILANKLKIKDTDSENQAETPKGNMPPGEADNTNKPAGKGDRHESTNSDETSQDSETSEDDITEVKIDGVKYSIRRVRDQSGADLKERSDDSIDEKSYVDQTGDTTMPADNVSFEHRGELNTPTSSKNAKLRTPCSGWHISDIAENLNFDEFVTKITIPTGSSHCLNNIYEMVQKDICRLLKVVKGIDLKGKKHGYYSAFLKQLIPITSIEAGSRLVLDALLVSLCSVLHLQFEVEKKIKHKDLPSCTYDYCIRKGKRIIGCIETKHVDSLSDTSIAQAILQVITLQKTLEQNEGPEFNMSEFPVFAIVTDGHRFIYIQLRGSSLGFEHDRDKVRVRKVTEYDDYKDIIQHIIFLVDEAVTPEI